MKINLPLKWHAMLQVYTFESLILLSTEQKEAILHRN
jgi:hypothetical protein